MVIIDDMISSGDSMIEVATELKKRKAGRIFICATFGLFHRRYWTSSTRLMRKVSSTTS